MPAALHCGSSPAALALFLAPRTFHFRIPDSLFWAIWLGFLAFIGLMLYAAFRSAKKRRADLEQFGMENGFLFTAKPDAALEEAMGEIRVSGMQVDSHPRFANVLQGSIGGAEAIVADATTGSGKSQSTATITAIKFGAPLPKFMLAPENTLWHLVEKLGFSDLDIDGAPDFSRRFFLHADDPAATRELFKPEVTQAFEALDPKTSLYVSASGRWLSFYRPGRLIAAQQLREFLQQVEPLAGAFRRVQSGSVFR